MNKIFRHSGTQSPTIFNEAFGRWLIYNKLFPDFHFFFHDIDHIGKNLSLVPDNNYITTIEESGAYSAYTHYFPFFGKIGKISFKDFIKKYYLPQKNV